MGPEAPRAKFAAVQWAMNSSVVGKYEAGPVIGMAGISHKSGLRQEKSIGEQKK
jgi:hypothetical protein